jgi:hypothetical protein
LRRKNDDIQELLNKTKQNKKTGMDAMVQNSTRTYSESKIINTEIKDIQRFD